MAASEIEIVNLALSHLGDRASVSSINPPDGSVQAEHAARFYTHARNWLLERFPWKFATRRETLAERSDLSFGSWDHVYEEPNACIRVISVLPSGYTSDDQGAEFDTESDENGAGLILTDAEDATVRFIAEIVDPARFSPGFTETLGWLLASMLAGPIVKGETGRAEAIRCLQAAQLAYSGATGLSAVQSRRRLDHIPAQIAARGQGGDVTGDATIIRS